MSLLCKGKFVKEIFIFQILPHDRMEKAPSDGAYIYGLFLDGARWDKEAYVPCILHICCIQIHI